MNVVDDTTITVEQPRGNRHRRCDRDNSSGYVGHIPRRPIHLHRRRADGHGPEPDQRSRGRRNSGDDHRHRLHRRTEVDFGTTAATGLTVVNDTTITVTSPAGTGTVNVTVHTPAGRRLRQPPISSPTPWSPPTVMGVNPT